MKPKLVPSLLGGLAALLGSPACSLVVDTSVPDTCIAVGDPCGSGGVCRENLTCYAALEPSCATNAECGGDQYCVNGACMADPRTEECPEVYPANALQSEGNKLMLGFIGAVDFAAGAADTSYGRPPLEGVQYALAELAAGAGIPGVGSGPRRNLSILACREDGSDGDTGRPARVARHLVEVAHVPAIIGGSTSGNTLRIWENYVRTASTSVLISPSATSPAITLSTARASDPENRLWRTAPSDDLQAALLHSLALDVREAIAMPAARVAMFYKDDAAGRGLATALDQYGLDEDFAGRFEPILYPESPGDGWVEQYTGRLFDDDAPLPNIIIALGTEEFVRDLMPVIEDRWPETTPRPWYVLPEGGRNVALATLDMQHRERALTSRVVGTAPGARRSAYYGAFSDFFPGQFNHAPGNLAEFGYDAAYALVYAIARANRTFPSGLQLAVALSELACGDDDAVILSPGTSNFNDKFESAAQAECVNLEGASGPLDFDENGEAVSDIATWCLRHRGNLTSFEPPLEHYYSASEEKRLGPTLNLADPNWCATSP